MLTSSIKLSGKLYTWGSKGWDVTEYLNSDDGEVSNEDEDVFTSAASDFISDSKSVSKPEDSHCIGEHLNSALVRSINSADRNRTEEEEEPLLSDFNSVDKDFESKALDWMIALGLTSIAGDTIVEEWCGAVGDAAWIREASISNWVDVHLDSCCWVTTLSVPVESIDNNLGEMLPDMIMSISTGWVNPVAELFALILLPTKVLIGKVLDIINSDFGVRI